MDKQVLSSDQVDNLLQIGKKLLGNDFLGEEAIKVESYPSGSNWFYKVSILDFRNGGEPAAVAEGRAFNLTAAFKYLIADAEAGVHMDVSPQYAEDDDVPFSTIRSEDMRRGGRRSERAPHKRDRDQRRRLKAMERGDE